MADTIFSSGTVIPSAWLNDVNKRAYKEFIDVKQSPYNAVGDGVVDDTAAIQAALSAAYSSGKALYLSPGNYSVTSLTLTTTGIRLNQSPKIFGDGKFNSRLTKRSGSSPLLTVVAADGVLNSPNLVIEDIGFYGLAKGSDGLLLSGIGTFTVNRCLFSLFNRNINLVGSLVGVIENCHIADGNYGILFRKNSAVYANAITVRDNQITANSVWGIDFGEGSMLRLDNNDLEINGTTGNAATGALIVRSTIDDEVGYGVVISRGNWYEANYGTSIIVENATAGYISMHGDQVLAAESGRAATIGTVRCFLAENSLFIGNTSVLSVAAERFTMTNSSADVITDNATISMYNNSNSSTTNYISGFSGSFTGSLTGCTTVPTGTISYIVQGRSVTLLMPSITGTSNSTAATITGMPAKIRPLATVVVTGITRDNGTEKFSPVSIDSSGVITLGNGFAGVFTASGTKGISSLQIKYEI